MQSAVSSTTTATAAAVVASASIATSPIASPHDLVSPTKPPAPLVRRKNMMVTSRSASLDATLDGRDASAPCSLDPKTRKFRGNSNSDTRAMGLTSMPFLRRWHKSYTSPKLVSEATPSPTSTARQVQSSHGGILRGRALARHRHNHHQENTSVDVFLGGSCNPTTWRRDIAVPLLATAQVAFYNPQVDEWYEELALIEAKAKEQAKIILMVVDNATRSIVGINEAVEYICRGRRVVLVVQDIVAGTKVEGSELGASEIADLNGARACLRNLATKRSIRVFEDVHAAVSGIIDWMQAEQLSHPTQDVPRLRKRTSIVLNEWSGYVRPARVTSRSCSTSSLTGVLGHDGGECEHCDIDENGSHKHCYKCAKGSVYLGGNLLASSWRDRIAIPLLKLAGIRYFVPGDDYLTHELIKATREKEAKVDEKSADVWRDIENEKEYAELILFVISGNARSIAAMTEAVELVCSHYALLLVIEPLLEGCIVEDGTPVTGRQYRDLRRARCYLQETAERHDIDVFDSVENAVKSIIERLR